MTSSRANSSSTPSRVVTKLMTSRPTSGAAAAIVSVMTLCRMLLLLEASLPPCQCKPVNTAGQSGTSNQNTISFQAASIVWITSSKEVFDELVQSLEDAI